MNNNFQINIIYWDREFTQKTEIRNKDFKQCRNLILFPLIRGTLAENFCYSQMKIILVKLDRKKTV